MYTSICFSHPIAYKSEDNQQNTLSGYLQASFFGVSPRLFLHQRIRGTIEIKEELEPPTGVLPVHHILEVQIFQGGLAFNT